MKYIKIFEEFKKEPVVEVYMMGDTTREMFIFITVDGVSIGGQLSGASSPIDGENQFTSMKIGIDEDYKGYGYGSLLYISSLSLLGEKGLSPHRRKDHTKEDAVNTWKRLVGKSSIKRIDLDEKIYGNNEILDSYYIMDKSARDKYSKSIKKISDDAFDESDPNAERAWVIVNYLMSH